MMAATPNVQISRAQSLFDKYGGFPTVRQVIMDFYDRVLDSDVVGHFFEDVDMRRLVDHQTKFIASLLGGPADFADERLGRAHAHLGVSHRHFDEIKLLLGATLQAAGFAPEDHDTVMEAVEARRTVIVA